MTGWRRWSCCVLLLSGGFWSCGASPELVPEAGTVWAEPSTGMEFVLLPAGRFAMGTPEGELSREAQEVLHEVRLSRPVYIARYEVTQAEWERVMGSNPSTFSGCARCPVEEVSFYDIEQFVARLEAIGGVRLRLPTEAEWEYACRAGTTTAFAWGDTLQPEAANLDGSDPYGPDAYGSDAYGEVKPGPIPESTVPVGSYSPNAWGLFDFHGNVWEWTADEHCPYDLSAGGDGVSDPLGSCGAELKVIRGGSWYYGADSARCGLRYTHRPQDVGPSLGFRLVRDVD